MQHNPLSGENRKPQVWQWATTCVNIEYHILASVAEFSASICSAPKFICSSNDGVLILLTTKNDASYKSNIYKNRMMLIYYEFKIEFIMNTLYLKVKEK